MTINDGIPNQSSPNNAHRSESTGPCAAETDLGSERMDQWSEKLHGDCAERQTEALRQISSEESVSGLTSRIVALAGSPDDEVRMWAAEAMETAVQPNASEVLMLIQLLEGADDGEICYWSATMLGRLGQDASAAAGALTGCLQDSSYLPARERATWALCQIGPKAEIAIGALEQAASNAPPRLRRLATEALQRIRAASANTSSSISRSGNEQPQGEEDAAA